MTTPLYHSIRQSGGLPPNTFLFSSLGAVDGQAITVPNGMTVLLDVDTPSLGEFRVDVGGTVQAYGDRHVTLTVTNIVVNGNWHVENGSGSFNGRCDIVFTGAPVVGRIVGPNATTSANDNGGISRSFMQGPGSSVRMHARRPVNHRTMLADHGYKDASQITVRDAVGDWKINDRFALPPTGFVLGPSDANRTTVHIVTAVSPDGKTISFYPALPFFRWGKIQYPVDAGHGEPNTRYASGFDGMSYTRGPQTPPTSSGMPIPTELDQAGVVMHLESNITLKGLNDSHWTNERLGGHYMVMDPGCLAETVVDGVLFERMGQGGALGRYAGVHWHVPSIDVATGAIIGQYPAGKAVMQNCVVYDSANRMFSMHGVWGAVARNNCGVKIKGQAMFFEDGSEQNCTWDGNWVYQVDDPGDAYRIKGFDGAPAALWVTNGQNDVINNRGGDCAIGIWYTPSGEHGAIAHSPNNGDFPDCYIDDTYAGGCFGLSKKVDIHPYFLAIKNWDNNTGHSCWANGALSGAQIGADEAGNTIAGRFISTTDGRPCSRNDGTTQIRSHFKRTKIWKNLGGAGYTNKAHNPSYDGWTVADNPGDGFQGATNYGISHNHLIIARSLYVERLPSNVPELYNGFATYHGSLIFDHIWGINFSGDEPVHSSRGTEASDLLKCTSLSDSWDFYLESIFKYFSGSSDWIMVNSIPMFRTPPPMIYQPTYAAYTNRTRMDSNGRWSPFSLASALYDHYGVLSNDPSKARSYIVFDQPFFTHGLTDTAPVAPVASSKTVTTANPYYGFKWDSNDTCLDGNKILLGHWIFQQVNKSDHSPIAGAVWDIESLWDYADSSIGMVSGYPHGYPAGTVALDSNQPAPGWHHVAIPRGARVLCTTPNVNSDQPNQTHIGVVITNLQQSAAHGDLVDDILEFGVRWSGSVRPYVRFGGHVNNSNGIPLTLYSDTFSNGNGIDLTADSYSFASKAAFDASANSGWWRDTSNNLLWIRLNAGNFAAGPGNIYAPDLKLLTIDPS